MLREFFIGRWSPMHEGHKKLIDTVLNEGKKVTIAIRDTPISETDPFTVQERIQKIKEFYPKAEVYYYPYTIHTNDADVLITVIPDLSNVIYGRKVGWGIREIHLDKDTESISATKIREQMKNAGQ